MINVSYQLTKDIDWFCIINGYPVHVASNGDRLPKFIRSYRQLLESQRRVSIIPSDLDFEVNRRIVLDRDVELESLGESFNDYFPEASNLLGDNEFNNTQKAYYWRFVMMAEKGFYSFDKIDIGQHDTRYRLVAWPKCKYKCNLKCDCMLFYQRYMFDFLRSEGLFVHISSINMSNINSLYSIDLVQKINEAYIGHQ